MRVKKFDEINEGFNIFNIKRTYNDDVKSNLHSIIENVNKISEKSFKNQDKIMDFTKEFIKNSEIKKIIEDFKNKDERSEYCAEFIYSKFKNEMNIKFN
jgi:hypothetical protein